MDGIIDDATVRHLRHRATIPTLIMMREIAKLRGANYANARDNVTALHRAGVPILVGTDAHPGPVTVTHGEAMHEELELLVEAGLTPIEVLTAATARTADRFSLTDRGRIAEGLRADLLLVDGDPTQDITATRAIRRVWCGGVAAPDGPVR
jgi:imidazolonepropionase-like amidohydrolase